MSSCLGSKQSAWVCLWPMAIMIAFKSGIQLESRWACNQRFPGRIWFKVEVCGVHRNFYFNNILYGILMVYNQWLCSSRQLSPLKYCWLGQPHSFTKGTPLNAGNPFHKSCRNLMTMQLLLPIEMQESCSWHNLVGYLMNSGCACTELKFPSTVLIVFVNMMHWAPSELGAIYFPSSCILVHQRIIWIYAYCILVWEITVWSSL